VKKKLDDSPNFKCSETNFIQKILSCGGTRTSDSGSTELGSPRISNDSAGHNGY